MILGVFLDPGCNRAVELRVRYDQMLAVGRQPETGLTVQEDKTGQNNIINAPIPNINNIDPARTLASLMGVYIAYIFFLNFSIISQSFLIQHALGEELS